MAKCRDTAGRALDVDAENAYILACAPDFGFHVYPRERWDSKICKTRAAKRGTDGLGTPNPYKGLVQDSGCAFVYYGLQRFNGGTIIDNKWYPGYARPWPELAAGYEFILISSWGVYIRSIDEE